MRAFALSAVGRDRPGIVAGVTGVLLDHGINIQDSQMTILRGRFAMTLVVAAQDDADVAALRTDLEQAGAGLGLDAVAIEEIGEDAEDGPDPSHIVSVYGVDHPGIVHAVSSALADRGWGITDLDTRVLGDESNPLYMMVLEVALPEGTSDEDLSSVLSTVGDEQGVEITSRPLESDTL
jgi:glycine cleavage system transcriptional repressor